jgi:hypothetical protein
MSGQRFAEPSFDPLLVRPQPGDGEHLLGQRIEPRIVGARASSDGTLSEPGNRDGLSAAPLGNSPPQLRRSIATWLRIASLPYLALIALVGVGITGAFIGSGFLLLKQPAKETSVGSDARGQSPAPPPEPPAPTSVAISNVPASSTEQPVAVPEATPTPSSVPPGAEPPARTAADPQPLPASHALSPPAIVVMEKGAGRPPRGSVITAEQHRSARTCVLHHNRHSGVLSISFSRS